jgi:hypothetical protein
MSTRSVADKLLIKPDTTLWSSHAARLGLVEPLPTGVRRVDAPEQATTALVFADDAASLRDLLARTRSGWPVRRSSGPRSAADRGPGPRLGLNLQVSGLRPGENPGSA